MSKLEDKNNTLPDVASEEELLPSEEELDKASKILRGIFSHATSSEPIEINDLYVRYVSISPQMWESEERRNGNSYVRVKCELTGDSFWVAKDESVPVLVFEQENLSWTKVISPALADGEREGLMRALAKRLSDEILDTSNRLEVLIRRARALYQQEKIQVDESMSGRKGSDHENQ